MNIEIKNNFDQQKIYSAFDNIIIEFGLNQEPNANIEFAEVIGLGFEITLSPSPDNIFYFNFNKFAKSFISKNKLIDNIDYTVNTQSINSFSKRDDEFMQGKNLILRVYFSDESYVDKSILLKYYRGVQDLERFNNYFFIDQNFDDNYKPPTIYYFPGYPLEIGVFTTQLTNIGFSVSQNATNNNSVEIQSFEVIDNFQFARLILSNGIDKIKSTNGNNLIDQMNEIYITDYSLNSYSVKIYNVKKYNSYCGGHYLKWLNRSGDFSYFLFHQNNEEQFKSSSLGTIQNDFYNKDFNPNRKMLKGKESFRELNLFYPNLDESMRLFLSDLIDSPRVYYYKGEKDSRASKFDWVQVEVLNNSFEIKRPKQNIFDLIINIEFPEYINQTI